MNLDLTRLMEKSESIIDLKDLLSEKGFKFSSPKQYSKWLMNEWAVLNIEKVKDVSCQVPKFAKFPNLIVNTPETQFNLHGIAHGQKFHIQPWLHPRQKVLRFVRENAINFIGTSSNSTIDCFWEENFSDMFGLDSKKELKDKSSLMDYKSSDLKKSFSDIILEAVGFTVNFVEGCTLMRKYGSMKNFDYWTDILSFNSLRALRHPEFQEVAQQLISLIELPQPFNLEAKYIINRSPEVLPRKGSSDEIVFAPTPGERSLWTSKKLTQLAKERNLSEVHYIGGGSHISEIAYFFDHPDYSFEELKQFSWGWIGQPKFL